MKLGARILKTGIAIVLALFAASFIDAPGGIVAGISALFAMQPSVYKSYRTIIEQLQGNTIGALLAILMVHFFGFNILISGLTSIILISLLLKLNLSNVVGLAVVTQLIIMDAHDGNFYTTALLRFSFVMIGVLSAFVVNTLFLPPKFETKMYVNCLNICGDIFKWIRLEINGTTEYHVVKRDLDDIKSRIEKLETQFSLYKEERAYTKKRALRNTRKKILFKEMIRSTRRAYDVLRKLNRYENDVLNLPEELKIQIKFELDELMTHHEEILMRVTEKIPNTKLEDHSLIRVYKINLIDAFLGELRKDESDVEYNKEHIFQVLGAMFEYREQLQHLDRLSHSFYKYHKDDRKINITNENLDL